MSWLSYLIVCVIGAIAQRTLWRYSWMPLHRDEELDRSAIAKQLALDPYERAAWAEIAALQLDEPLPQELVATGKAPAIKPKPIEPARTFEVPALTLPEWSGAIPATFGTTRIATGFLRDSFKDQPHRERSRVIEKRSSMRRERSEFVQLALDEDPSAQRRLRELRDQEQQTITDAVRIAVESELS